MRRAEAGILAEIRRGAMTAAELGAFRAWVQAERAQGAAPMRRVYGVNHNLNRHNRRGL